MKISSSLLLSVMVGVFILFAVQAEANVIGLYNTGVDNSNTLLSAGAIDPHYTLIQSADPSFPGPAAYVVDDAFAAFAWSYTGINANGPYSKWLSPNPDNSLAWGSYIYQTTFNLTGLNPSSALITGQWSTDNEGYDILLNGHSTGNTIMIGDSHAFCDFHPFTISSGFVSGLNTLDFIVHNDGGPSGIRVEMSGTANAATVPIPGAVWLLGSGLIGLVGIRRRFKQ
ncbi:MAG: VPLPA-CTERM sorting domain-containing protein [Syntrophales bacterium]|jgi:hypothetical protein